MIRTPLASKFSGIAPIMAICLVLVSAVFATRAEALEWKWLNPSPVGETFYNIDGTDQNNVYAVGIAGAFYKYNGTAWSQLVQGNNNYLYNAIWIRTTSEMYLGGSDTTSGSTAGQIWKFNGSTLTAMNMPTSFANSINSVWGTSDAAHIYAVGDNGSILKFSSAQDKWIEQTSPTTSNLYDVYGFASNNIWAVGSGGVILHSDGTTWNSVTSPTSMRLNAVWGPTATTVYAVGQNTTRLLYNGTSWTVDSSGSLTELFDIRGPSGTSFMMLGDGGQVWTYSSGWGGTGVIVGSDSFKSIYGAANGEFFAVGGAGSIYHYKNATWTNKRSRATIETMRDVWGTDSGMVYAVADGGVILQRPGINGAWSPMTLNSDAQAKQPVAMAGHTKTDMKAVSSLGAILNYNNITDQWELETVYQMAGGTTPSTYDICAVPGNLGRYIVVGSSALLLSNLNGTWAEMERTTTPNGSFESVFCYSSTVAYAVGDGGLIYKYEDSIWAPMTGSQTVTTENLYSIWGPSENSLWAVGNNGTVLYYNGETWAKDTTIPSTYSATRFPSVWGYNSANVYVAGGNSLLKYNGTSWSKVAIPTTFNTFAIWGSIFQGLYVVGDRGTILYHPYIAYPDDYSTLTVTQLGTVFTATDTSSDGLNGMKVDVGTNSITSVSIRKLGGYNPTFGNGYIQQIGKVALINIGSGTCSGGNLSISMPYDTNSGIDPYNMSMVYRNNTTGKWATLTITSIANGLITATLPCNTSTIAGAPAGLSQPFATGDIYVSLIVGDPNVPALGFAGLGLLAGLAGFAVYRASRRRAAR